MKRKWIPFFLLFFLTVITLNAQASHCFSGGEESQHAVRMAAAKAAAQDENIVERADRETGEIAYFRKDICPKTGESTLCPVEYCTKSGRFVNLSSGGASSCTRNGGKAPAGGASAQSSSGSSSDTDTSVAQRAACSSAFSKAKTNSRKASIPVKLVSNWQ